MTAFYICGEEQANCFACARDSKSGTIFRQQAEW